MLTPITVTKAVGQQRQIWARTGGLVTMPKQVLLNVVDLKRPATDPRRHAYPDVEKQKKALEAKVHRVGAALTVATKRLQSWKATRGLPAVQLMLYEEDSCQQLAALLAKRGLQLQPIPKAAPTPGNRQAGCH